jgi:hypothetical protein
MVRTCGLGAYPYFFWIGLMGRKTLLLCFITTAKKSVTFTLGVCYAHSLFCDVSGQYNTRSTTTAVTRFFKF